MISVIDIRTFQTIMYKSFDASIRIELEDLKMGEFTNIRANPAYTFQAITSDDAHRFSLHFNEVRLINKA